MNNSWFYFTISFALFQLWRLYYFKFRKPKADVSGSSDLSEYDFDDEDEPEDEEMEDEE